ncbi:RNA polymerase sigma-70 factor (ECF subfamily) [Sphingobium sp. B2D3A]|uniref:RNA polymerase sigma factor n=1 Tax=unclassified Sphingobium TaxID=2611147 RepID=UPI00222560E4|nr:MULTISPECIES: sigma factor-like helix-turn-helix DNA-binding protein [unclassified Sphingobium]MCW2337485.1 RNA polymerase sigma-70 factor (ECF subfamily) [Sphingobium sp. B2D3A]MCW2383943.1 RNA polymerase sigma-70 factor (ECF subfamily) [Sphingobium sp. B2D3D]
MAAYGATVNPTSAREVMATAEELARMEAALLTLPRLTREVFLAHRIDDLSYAEIAEITGLGVRQVERRMADALYGLHCALQGGRLRRRRWWGRRRW